MWLSDVFSQNDPSELRYGIKYALGALDLLSEDRRVKIFAKLFKDFVDQGVQRAAGFFIASLSCDGDELGQWRAYADDGRGFALGFDSASLIKAFESNAQKLDGAWSAVRLNYESAELQKIQSQLSQLLPAAFAALSGKQLTQEQWAAYMTTLSSLFSLAVIEIAMLSKHSAYRAENEIRFSTVFKMGRTDNVLSRRRSETLVRYIEFDWMKQAAESLREIVIGPSADRDTAHKLAMACLEAYHPRPGSVEIRYSEIPYRSVRLR